MKENITDSSIESKSTLKSVLKDENQRLQAKTVSTTWWKRGLKEKKEAITKNEVVLKDPQGSKENTQIEGDRT